MSVHGPFMLLFLGGRPPLSSWVRCWAEREEVRQPHWAAVAGGADAGRFRQLGSLQRAPLFSRDGPIVTHSRTTMTPL